MGQFDNTGRDGGADPLADEPASGVEEKEQTSGVLHRSEFRSASSTPAPSGDRPRAPFGSTPHLEIGDPVTYDPISTDGTFPESGLSGGEVDEFAPTVAKATSPAADPAWREAVLAEIDNDETDDAEDEDEDEDPHLGATISDRYVIDGVLGEGGMGKVYSAKHKVIGKRVAIKILHAELARDKAAVGRFVREAQAASSVGNPHIVDVADFGDTDDGSTYFVMEYLDGPTLTDLIESKGSLDTDEVCDLTLQLADGLEAAHQQEIVHRDLKPDNITLIEQGANKQFCKILDFGIAKVNTSASSTKLTMAGAVFGTPHYMSPEQAAGAAVDHRTDIYSLGVIMYEMTSGQLPFNADNFMGILTQHMYKAPVPIRAMVGAPNCSPGLEAVILKCLSKKADARYDTMEALADDVRRVQTGEVPTAVHDMMARSGGFNVPADYFQAGRATTPELPTGKRRKIKPAQIAMFAGIVAAVSIVTFVLLKNNESDAKPAPLNATTTQPTTSPAAAEDVDVMLHSNAPAATAWVGTESFSLPKLFTVTDGTPLSVKVTARGYADTTIDLDGSTKEVKVTQRALPRTMKPVGTPTPKPSSRAITTPRPRSPGPTPRTTPRPSYPKPGPKPVDGVVDPWGK